MALSGPARKPKSGQAADSLVILLHGYGSNGDDLIALADQWAPILPNTEFVSPNAPDEVGLAPNGYQWFELTGLNEDAMAEGAREARPVVDQFIDEQMARLNLPASRVALVGFSQGTMMCLHTGLRRKEQLAGILGYSGALPATDALKDEIQSRPPVRLIHGDHDDVLPVAATFLAVEQLREAGVSVDWHICHRLHHSIDASGLAKGGRFLTRLLT